MAFDARFLHWQQAPDEELLYHAGELVTETVEEVSGDGSTRATPPDWEALARAVSRENAALREDDPWPIQ